MGSALGRLRVALLGGGLYEGAPGSNYCTWLEHSSRPLWLSGSIA